MKRKYPLGVHIQVLLSNPEFLYKLTVYPLRIAFLSVRMKILEARISLRDWMKAIRKK
jgi:hypothetical protein